MLAAFLKTDDGDFNIPAFLVSLFITIMAAALLGYLPKALRSGRIHFEWTPSTGRTIKFNVEREKNPAGFWSLFVVYCFCIILEVMLIIVICFGLLRKPV